MDGGCPVHLLVTWMGTHCSRCIGNACVLHIVLQSIRPTALQAVQYRMHPEIRAFPGDFFYDARLKDGFCVLNASDEPFYKHPDLGPYRFFDVSFGTESRSASKSVSNTAEVSVVASLVLELLATLNGGAGSAHVFHRPYQVTVITPYRAQLSLLRRTLGKLRINVSLISPLTFETVDSFQGKQADIIILSCVRTLPGAVGFVSDVRRLNVAITRAKRALWIVGNAYALATSSDVWQKLVEDAKARGHFCHTPEDIVQVHKPLVS